MLTKTDCLHNDYISEQRFISPVKSDMGIFDVNIYTSQMGEDIDVLSYILNNIYSGKDFLKNRGISISEKPSAPKAIMQSVRSINKADFFRLLCSVLDDIKDNHLVFSLPYFKHTHQFCAHNTVRFAGIKLQKSNDDYVVVTSDDPDVKCGDCYNRTEAFIQNDRRNILIR